MPSNAKKKEILDEGNVIITSVLGGKHASRESLLDTVQQKYIDEIKENNSIKREKKQYIIVEMMS